MRLGRLLQAAVTVGGILLSGCGGGDTGVPQDPIALLEKYHFGDRYDPMAMTEVDLGEFEVNRRLAESFEMLFLRFRLVAVVPKDQKVEFERRVEERGQRLRDRLQTLVQTVDTEALTDPTMALLKAEMVTAMSRTLESPALRDVVVTEFSLHRG